MKTLPATPAEQWRQQHPFLPAAWQPAADLAVIERVLPDVNPADRAVQRLRAQSDALRPPPLEDAWHADMESIRAELRQLRNGAAGISAGDWPLKLTQVDTEFVKVLLGTVNGILPTNVATNIDINGTDGTWNIYLDATVSATTGAVSAVTITASTSAVPADTSTHAYLLIGQAVVASAAITSVSPALAWSQDFTACTPGDPDTYHWNVA